MEKTGSPFDLIATIGWAVLAMAITLPYVAEHLGLIAAIVAGLLFPITAPILPLIMFIIHGHIWAPIIIYGSSGLILLARKFWGQWI